MKKFGKICMTLATVSVAVAAMCSLAACADNGENKGNEGENGNTDAWGITLHAPSQETSHWSSYTADTYLAENLSSKEIGYQLVGEVDIYGVVKYHGCMNLYKDGFTVFTVYSAQNSVMDETNFVYYGYWKYEAEDETITVYEKYMGSSGQSSASEFTGSSDFVVDGGKLSGNGNINLGSFGSGNLPVESDGTIKYATDAAFKAYVQGLYPDEEKPGEGTEYVFKLNPVGMTFTGSAYGGYLVQTVTLAADGAATLTTTQGADSSTSNGTWSFNANGALEVTLADATKTVNFDTESKKYTLDFGSGAVLEAAVPVIDLAGKTFSGSAYDGYLVQTVTFAAGGTATVETKMGGQTNSDASGAATWAANADGVIVVTFGDRTAEVKFNAESGKYTLDLGSGATMTETEAAD